MKQQQRAATRFQPNPLSQGVRQALAALGTAALAGSLHANPQGGVVVGGQASIAQPSAGLMQIHQATDRAAIDWRSFSIGAGEAVRFIQPSATSAMLNRVVGNEPSSILGSMSANGRVYLVNQNGVFIGRGAQIDTAGLVLSTANISNGDFMAGRMVFDQPGRPGARIVNEGSITVAQGGLVAMVAPGVENRGTISARLGQVMLAGAQTFSLDLYGDGLVNMAIKPADLAAITDAGGTPLSHYVDQSGRITAEGGRVWISAATARGLVDGSVNVSGAIRATREAGRGGEVTLLGGDRLAIGGTVEATGVGEGGRIAASAVNVALTSGVVLDASGTAQGGTVLVGGSYQGLAPVPGAASTASRLDVAAGARVRADGAGTSGSGGTVVLWSEEATRFEGSASARAGREGGNGGLIEVSGRKQLAFSGQADASAPRGRAGMLLLDPGNLTVAETGGTNFNAVGSDATVAASAINDTLRGGTPVTLRADDDIAINAVIDGRPFNGSTEGSTGGGLHLRAGGSVAVNKAIVLNDGAFSSVSERGTFTQADGALIATLGSQSIAVTAAGNVTTRYLLTSGDLDLTSKAGNVTALTTIGGGTQSVANFSATAKAGTVSVLNGLQASGKASFDAAEVRLGQAIVGGVLRADGGNIVLQGDVAAGGLQVGSKATPAGSFTMAGGTPQVDAGASGVSVFANGIGALGAIRSKADIMLDATAGSVTVGTLETEGAGNIAVGSAGNIDLPTSASILSRGGTVTLRSNAGGITAAGTIAADDPAASAPATNGKIVLEALNAITVDQLVGSGSVRIASSKGDVDLTRTLGGDDPARPTIGRLEIEAGGNVFTRGLNLAGTTDPAQRGLSITAGGRIEVQQRIGVTRGDLWFGPETVSFDQANRVVLQQGVYARNGQSITFNAPVVADGSRIMAEWQRLRGEFDQGAQVGSQFVDMVLIPEELANATAQTVVENGGGLRVTYDHGTKAVTSICDPNAPCSGTTYWMIPKIVISNQETATAADAGSLRLRGGTFLAPLSSTVAAPSAAIKLIFPYAGSDIDFLTVDAACQLNACPTPVVPTFPRLELGGNVDVFGQTSTKGNFGLKPPVENSNVWMVREGTPPTTVSLAAYPGVLRRGDSFVSIDINNNPTGVTPEVPSYTYESNSAPTNFFNPSVTPGNPLNLAQQLAAVLPGRLDRPAGVDGSGGGGGGGGGETVTGGGGGGGGNGGGPVVAVVPVVTDPVQDDNAPSPLALVSSSPVVELERGCQGPARTLVGRSPGDEADVGLGAPLRGAPRPVFTTQYSLGDVADVLAANVDVSAIQGRQPGAGGGCS